MKSLKDYRLINKLKPTGRFVPILSFKKSTLAFPYDQYSPLAENRYDWYTLFFGIGPELGLETYVGVFYIDLVPGWGWHKVEWQQAGQKEVWSNALHFYAEFGWSFFVSTRINLRIFGASISVPAEMWSEVMNRSQVANAEITDTIQSFGGLSFSYYFPESRNLLKKSVFE